MSRPPASCQDSTDPLCGMSPPTVKLGGALREQVGARPPRPDEVNPRGGWPEPGTSPFEWSPPPRTFERVAQHCHDANAVGLVLEPGVVGCGCVRGFEGRVLDEYGRSTCVVLTGEARLARTGHFELPPSPGEVAGMVVLTVLPAIVVALYLASARARTRWVGKVCFVLALAGVGYLVARNLPLWVRCAMAGWTAFSSFAWWLQVRTASAPPVAPVAPKEPSGPALEAVARPPAIGPKWSACFVSLYIGLATAGAVGGETLYLFMPILFLRAVLLGRRRHRLIDLGLEASALVGATLVFDGMAEGATLCVLAVLGLERILPRRAVPHRGGALAPAGCGVANRAGGAP